MFKSKNAKKVLSILLASIVMSGSISLFCTSTNAAYFSDGSEWKRNTDDYGKIDVTLTNTDYQFMQTEDNQEFAFNQHLSLQKGAGEAYAYFNSMTLYEGLTNTDSSLKIEEYPKQITSNGTQELLNSMDFKYSWTPTNNNASEVGVTDGNMNSYALRGTVVDLSGCPDYQWDCALSFKVVHPEEIPYGEINTNFYWDFNWTYADVGLMGNKTTRSVRVCTEIEVTDVRELLAKINEYKNELENYKNGNPNGLTGFQALKINKYINTVPTNMIDGSKFYPQSEVDAMYDYITGKGTGLADYSEYYQIYKKLAEITRKSDGVYVYGNGYTQESLDSALTILTQVSEGLDKALLATEQETVDEATYELQCALKSLVAKSLYTQDHSSNTTDDVWDLEVDGPGAEWDDGDGAELDLHIVGTKYKYMQTYDDQQFTLYQWLYVRSKIDPLGSLISATHPTLNYFVFDTSGDCNNTTTCYDEVGSLPNNTVDFISRLSSDSVTETENGTGYAKWDFLTHDKRYYDDDISNPKALAPNSVIESINISETFLKARYTYLADANMQFIGLGENEKSIEQNLSYVWKFEATDNDNTPTVYDFHVPVTVLVTDARDLVKLYYELNNLANGAEDEDEANRLKYTEESINGLRPVLETIPQTLLYGSEYYEQAEVDTYYNTLLTAKNSLESIADYSEFDSKYNEALSITNENDAVYEPTAFAEFQSKIEGINAGLDRRIGVTQQELVDAETQKLADLMVVLEQNAYCDYTELDYLIKYAEENFPENNADGEFKDDIYAAMMEALSKAKAIERGMVKGVDGVNQKAIDAAAEELLYTIYYDYYDSSAKDIIAAGNVNGENKIYLEEAFEKFKTDYENATNKLEQNIKDETVSNNDAFKDAVTDLSGAHTTLEENKIVDLTEINNAIEAGKNIENNGYTDSSWNNLQDAVENAEDLVETNPVQGVEGAGSKEVEDAKDAILDAIDNLAEKADYTEYNELKATIDEIIAVGKGDTHTQSDWEKFVDSVTEIDNALDKDLSKNDQAIIDSAVSDLTHAKEVYESSEKADYSKLDEAITRAENILNDTENTYTESSKLAVKDAYDEAKKVDRDLSKVNQTVVDELLGELNDALVGIKVKADYSSFDEAVKNAEEALNNTEITYTSSTKQALENALNLKETVGRDLSTDDQAEIDSVTNAITEATTNLTEAADVSAYEEAKKTADEILADGNDNGRYPEEIWDSLVETVTEAENVIGDNTNEIPKSEQQKLDDITGKLNNATRDIENKSYVFVEFRDEHNNIFNTFKIMKNEGKTFNDLEGIPSIPESNSLKKYVGWYYADGKKMNLTDAITKDVALFCIEEEIKLVTDSESGAFIDEENDFFKGLKHGTTVENLLTALENDLDYIVVKDKDGNIVENTAVVATGMTVELISKTEQTVKNEIVTVVVKGDINGDGLVNDDDFDKSVDMCLGNTSYTESDKAYFEANDIDDDGVLDGIDLFFISNMRFGN